ncbi:MAG: Cof-type HAD-IIB family hydrolase [Clostridia bacterium]|nr:Cof-type HAD-IIB family hydrolase [Clostridia bacterium]
MTADGNKIKAIFFDVDGTLFSHRLNDVPESTRRALKALRDRGVLTVVATGRHMIEYSQLPVGNIEFDGYLTLNGQLLLDSNRKVYAGTAINEGEMKVLAGIFKRKQIPFLLVGEDQRYINFVDETVLRTTAETKQQIPDTGIYNGEKIYQILAFVPEEQKRILDELLDECSITSWNDTGIDIIPKGGGKSAGIQKFLDEHGLDRTQIMAFGDGENDIDMLQFAGIGVAMGNAGEAVKAAADYVTSPVDEDGIENALRHFGLID